MRSVTHFKLISTDPRPRYRMRQMQLVPHTGRALNLLPKERSLANFAEALAAGCTGEEAARRAGYSPCSASYLKGKLAEGAST